MHDGSLMVFGHEEADRKLTAEDAKMFRRGRSIKGKAEDRRAMAPYEPQHSALFLFSRFRDGQSLDF